MNIIATVILVQDDHGNVYQVQASANLKENILHMIAAYNGNMLPVSEKPIPNISITPNEPKSLVN